MSSNVDEQVVQMRFNNKEFERNAQETLGTLDKLREKLNFEGASKGLEVLGQTVKKIDILGLTTAVDAVGKKFSWLEQIATGALRRIGDDIAGQGERLLKSFTIDPVAKGWDKLAAKTTAVQTIMAATHLPIEEVNEQLSRLVWFADETSYSLTDMTSNIGKFTSQGVKLDTSVKAMEGISTWASLSGQGVNEAARAMYNLSQALGVGAVKLQDWKSIENANMATEEFKKMALETAAELGTLTKKTDEYGNSIYMAGEKIAVSTANFSQTLSEGWFSKDVLLEVLQNYGSFADRVSDIYNQLDGAISTSSIISDLKEFHDKSEALTDQTILDKGYLEDQIPLIRELASEVGGVGQRAFAAAQEAKTLTEAISATAEATQTVWAKIFENIFGNYEEQVVLWTDLANGLYDLFVEPINAVNELFSEWKDETFGGRSDLIESLYNIANGLVNIIDSVKEAFHDIFPPKTVDDLKNFTLGFKDLSEKFLDMTEHLDTFKYTLKGVFSVIETLRDVISTLITGALHTLDGLLQVFGLDIRRLSVSISESIQKWNKFMKTTQIVTNVVKVIVLAIVSLAVVVKNLIHGFLELPAVNKVLQTLGTVAQTVFFGLVEYMGKVISAIAGFIERCSNLNGLTFENVKTAILDFFQNVLGTIFNVQGIIDWFQDKFGDFFKAFDDKATGVIGVVKALIQSFVEFWKSAFQNIQENFTAADAYAIALGVIVGIIALNAAKLIKVSAELIEGLSSVVNSIKGVANSALKVLKGIAANLQQNVVKQIAVAAIEFAAAIMIVATAIWSLSELDKKNGNLWDVIAAIGVLSAILVGTAGILAVLSKFVSNSAAMAGSILMVAVAIGIFAVSMDKLEAHDPGKMTKYSVGILAMGAAIAILCRILSTNDAGIRKAIGTALMFVVLSKTMVSALDAINEITLKEGIAEKILALAGVCAAFGVMVALINLTTNKENMKAFTKFGIGMVAISASIKIFVWALESFEKLNISNLIDKIDLLKELLYGIMGMLLISKLAGEHMSSFGSGILKITISMLLMVGLLKLLESIPAEEFERNITKMKSLMTSITMLLIASSFAGQYSSKAGAMILEISGALLVMILAVNAIKKIKEEELNKAVNALNQLMVAIALLIGVSKFAEKVDWKIIGVLSAGLVLLGLELMGLANIPKEKLLSAVLSMSSIILSLGIAVKCMQGVYMGETVKSLGSLMIFVLTIGGVCAALTVIDNVEKSIYVAGGMAELLIALGISMKLMDNIKVPKIPASTFLEFIGILVIAGGVLGALALIPFEDNWKVIALATGISEIIIAFSGAINLLNNVKINKTARDTLNEFAWIAGIMTVLLATFATLDYDINSMITLAGSLSGFLIALAYSVKVLDGVKEINKTARKTLIEMAAIAAGVAVVLGIVGKWAGWDLAGMITMAASVSLVLLAIATSVKLLQGVKGIDAKIIGTLAVLVLIVGALGLVLTAVAGIQTIDDGFLEKCAGISLVLATLAAISAVLSLFKMSDPAAAAIGAVMIMGLTVVVWALVNVMEPLNKIDSNGMVEKCAGLTLLLIGLAAASAILGTLGLIGPAALIGIAVVVVLIAAIAGVILGLGYLFTNFKELQPLFDVGCEYMIKLGAAIGEAMGQFIGHLVGAFSEEALKRIGDALTEFAGTIKEAIQSFDGITESQIQRVFQVLEAMGMLWGIEWLFTPSVYGTIRDQITSWLGAENPLDKMKTLMKGLGEAVVEYCDAIKDVDVNALSNGVQAAQLLASTLSALPNTGGLIQDILGSVDIEDFKNNLGGFGVAMLTYSVSAANISLEGLQKGYQAATYLGPTLDALPDNEGFMPWLLGKDNLEKLSEGLDAYSGAIVGYSIMMAAVSMEGMKKGVEAAGKLQATLLSLDSRTSSIWDMFTDNAGLMGICNVLPTLGSAISGYFAYYENLTFNDAMNNIVPHLRDVVALARDIESIDATAIATFGATIQQLASIITTLAQAFDTDTTVLQALRNLLSKLENEAISRYSMWETIGGAYIRKMDSGVEKEGNNLVNHINTMLNNVENDMIKRYDNFYSIGSWLMKSLQAGVSEDQSFVTSMAAVAAEGEEAFRNVVGVHSLSMIFWKIGEWIVKSVAKGNDDNNEVLNNSMAASGVGAVDSMTQGVATGFENNQAAMNAMANNSGAQVGNNFKDGLRNALDKGKDALTGFLTENGLGDYVNRLDAFNLFNVRPRNTLVPGSPEWIEQQKRLSEQRYGTHYKTKEEIEMQDMMNNTLTGGGSGGSSTQKTPQEEALEKITKQYSDTVDKCNNIIKSKKLEFELWTETHPNASDQEKTTMQMQNYKDNLIQQMEIVKASSEQYRQILALMGQDAKETMDAQNTATQEKINLAKILTDINNLQNGGAAKSREDLKAQLADLNEAMKHELDIIAECSEMFTQAGLTQEQIYKKYWELSRKAEQVSAQLYGETAEDLVTDPTIKEAYELVGMEMGNSTAQGIMQTTPVIENGIEKTVSTGMTKGVANASTSKEVTNATYTSGTSIIQGIADAIKSNQQILVEALSEAISKAVQAASEKVNFGSIVNGAATVAKDGAERKSAGAPGQSYDWAEATSGKSNVTPIRGRAFAPLGVPYATGTALGLATIAAIEKKTGVNLASTVNNNYNITQNNTSPKSLSAGTIYRQTQNIVSALTNASKGGVSK